MAKPNSQISKSVRSDSQQPEIENRFSAFLEKHKDLMGYIGVGLVIVLVLLTLINLNNRSKEKQASLLLQQAIEKYEAAMVPEQVQKETEEDQGTPSATATPVPDPAGNFKEITDNYPNTAAGRYAVLLLASVHLNNGRNTDAITVYDQFIEKNRDSSFVPQALLGKAAAQFNNNQIPESLQTLEYIIQKYPSYEQLDAVKLEIGKRLEAQSKWAEARTIYKELIDNHPDSSFKQTAQTKINDLEKKHPEIKPAATSPEESTKPPA